MEGDCCYGPRRSPSECRLLGRQSRGWLELLVLWLFRLSTDPDDPKHRTRVRHALQQEQFITIDTD